MKRRYLTLIEIMIVIVLIGLIGGVVAYNVSGSLEEGKAFKTKQGASQLGNALMLEVATGEKKLQELPGKWEDILKTSPLVKAGGKDLIKDGWGERFVVVVNGDKIKITSAHYETYYKKKHASYDADDLILY